MLSAHCTVKQSTLQIERLAAQNANAITAAGQVTLSLQTEECNTARTQTGMLENREDFEAQIRAKVMAEYKQQG